MAALTVLVGLVPAPMAMETPRAAASEKIGVLTVHAGLDRIETALRVSQAAFATGADRVYVTSAVGFADSLAGGTLEDGPILLVAPNGPARTDVIEEIDRLAPVEVIVLGGPAAVAGVTTASIARDGRSVRRVAGPTRHETAVAVSRERFPSGASAVYLARSDTFQDALAAGGVGDGPILLVPPTGAVPDAVRSEIVRLDPSQLIVLGPASGVSDAAVVEAANGRPWTRLSGVDRYETAVRIAEHVVATGGAGDPMIASGLDFPDALASGPIWNGPVLPVPACDGLPASTERFLEANRTGHVTLLGGPGAICDGTVARIEAAAAVVDQPLIHEPEDFVTGGATWPERTVTYRWGPGTSDLSNWQSVIRGAGGPGRLPSEHLPDG